MNFDFFLILKGSPTHETPPIPGVGEGLDYSFVRNLILHCKRLVPRLEPMTTKSHKSNFIVAPRFPFLILFNFLSN